MPFKAWFHARHEASTQNVNYCHVFSAGLKPSCLKNISELVPCMVQIGRGFHWDSVCFNHSRGWGCSSDSRVLAFKSDILGLIPYITLKKKKTNWEYHRRWGVVAYTYNWALGKWSQEYCKFRVTYDIQASLGYIGGLQCLCKSRQSDSGGPLLNSKI